MQRIDMLVIRHVVSIPCFQGSAYLLDRVLFSFAAAIFLSLVFFKSPLTSGRYDLSREPCCLEAS